MKPWKLFNFPRKAEPVATTPAPVQQPLFGAKPFKARTYITRARRLDWDAATETWENWTDRDILVGAVGADAVTLSQVHVSGSYNPNLVKAKPFAGQKERFAVEDAIDAGKTTVVATPETHPGFAIGECPDSAPHGHGRAWGGPQQSFGEIIRITETDEAGAPEHYFYMICKGFGGGYTYGQQTIGQSGWNGYESYGWGDSGIIGETKNGKPLWTGHEQGEQVEPDTLDLPCQVCQRDINDCRCTVEDLCNVGICWICNGNFLVATDNPKACRCPESEMSDLSIGIDFMRTPGVPRDGHKPGGTKGLSDDDLLLIGWDLIADGDLDPCDNDQSVIEATRQWMKGES